MKRKKKIKTNQIYYHLMLLPATVLVFLFVTRTWPGILIAFQNYNPTKGIWGSSWVGWKNFKIYFMQPDCVQILRNTLVLAIGKIVGCQVTSIVFALLVNEVRQAKLKKAIQTAVYLPHFISWVIYATILKSFIGTDGVFNRILASLGHEKYMFLGTPSIFPGIMILTEVLKEFGFGSIIYLSAITSISQDLYEAAQIDGATRLQQTWHITLPGIRYIIVLNSVLSLGNLLNAGFDQVFNMYNSLVMSTADIIDTWVYRQGFISYNYGVGTAVGLFKSVIAIILTVLAYWAAVKFADYKIF